MNEAEYVLSIILKARDQFAAVFAKARAEIRGMRGEMAQLNATMNTLNGRVSSLGTRFKNFRKEVDDARGSLGELAQGTKADFDKLEVSVEKNTAAVAKSSRAARAAARENRDVNHEFDRMVGLQEELTRQFQRGERSRADYIEGLRQIGKEARAMQGALDVRDSSRDIFGQIARDAEQSAKRMAAADEAQTRSRKQRLEELSAASRAAERERDVAARRGEANAQKEAAATRARAEAERERKMQIQATVAELDSLNRSVDRNGRLTGVQQQQFRRLRGELTSAQRAYGATSSEFEALGRHVNRIDDTFNRHNRVISQTSREHQRFARTMSDGRGFADRFSGGLDRLASRLLNNSDNVSKLDNNLRGMIVLGVLVFAQQLSTILQGLGGMLIAVGSSAVMAGAGLAGMADTALAQALPGIGLIIASLARLKSIMDAVQQSDLLRKQQFAQGQKAEEDAANRADQLANAQDGVVSADQAVADAHRQVIDATNQLAKARADGRRELEDLILAEKRAELAARGAALSQREAQDALRQAVSQGVTGTELQRREVDVSDSRLQRRQASVQLGRARVDAAPARPGGAGVEDLKSVQQARSGLDDAKRSLDNAERSADRAGRALQKAQRDAANAGKDTLASASALQFMLSQLTPVERKLYEAIQRLRETYRTNFRPITDIIIGAFSRGVNTAERLLRRRDLLDAAKDLATGMSAQMDRIRKSFTSDQAIRQFIRIVAQAKDNLGPLGTIAIRVGHALMNIAEAAGPAFHRFLGFVADLAGKFLGMTRDQPKLEHFFNTAERHLESWVKLGVAVIRFFAALTGTGQKEGKKGVDDLTDSLNDAADSINKNRSRWEKFFHQARQVTDAVLGVLKDLGKELARSFNPAAVEGFARFLRRSVIPALGVSVRAVGALVTAIMNFLAIPIVADVAKYAIALLLFSKVVTGLTAVGAGAITQFAHFFRLMTAGPAAFGKATKAVLDYGKALKFGAEAQTILDGHASRSTRIIGALGGGITKFATVARGAAAFAFGPWGLLIAAVVVGVVLLLKHFGRLDDVLDGLKRAWHIFTSALQGPLNELKDALDDLGIHLGKTGGAMKVLNAVGQVLADFISAYLVRAFALLAHMIAVPLAMAIRVLAGGIRVIKGVADVLIGLFTLDFDQVGRGFGSIAKGIIGIGKAIVEGFIGQIKNVVGLITLPFRAAWAAVKHFFGVSSPSRKARDLGDAIVDGVVAGLRTIGRLIAAPFRAAWRAVRAVFDGAKRLGGWIIDKIADGIRNDVNLVSKAALFVWDKLKDGFNGAKNFGKNIVNWIVDGIKTLPDRLSDVIHSMGSALGDIGKRIGKALWEGVKKIPGLGKILGLAGKAAGLVGDAVDRLPFATGGPVPGYGGGDVVAAALEPGEHVITKEEVRSAGGHGVIYALRRLFGGGGQGGPFGFMVGGQVPAAAAKQQVVNATASINMDADVEGFARKWRLMWQEVTASTRRNTNRVEEQIRDMRVNTQRTLRRMLDDNRDLIVGMEMSAKVHVRRMADAWGDSFRSIKRVSYDGLFYVAHEANKALTGLGEKHIDFHLSRPNDGDDHKATGGVIGQWGERGRDAIRTWLGRGEVVLNHWQQRAVNAMLPGQLTLQDAFRQRGFHAGGEEQPGFARGRFTTIPSSWGQSAEEVASSIFGLLQRLQRRYKFMVTDGFDRDHSAGHKSPGHNVTGTAVDMVPGAGGSWGLIEALGRWAVSKGLIVGYDAHVPGAQLWPDHGRGNHIHIEFGNAKALSGEMPDTSVGRPRVSPREHPLAKMVQHAIDRVRKAANEKISSSLGQVSGDTSFLRVAGANARSVFDYFRRRGFSDEQAAAWVGNLTQESGLSTTIVNKTSGATGLAQWLGGRLSGLKQFAGHKDWRSLEVQLNYIWKELQGPESAAYRAIKAAKSLEAAVRAIAFSYERMGAGEVGDRLSPAQAALRRFGGGHQFAKGGEVPGPDGQGVPILAHAGEWIVNRFQQSRLASLLGMSPTGLRSLLGFHGGPIGFAGGGEIEDADTSPMFTTAANRTRLQRLLRGVYELPMVPIETWSQLVREMGRAFKAIDNAGKKIRRKLNRDLDDIEKLTAEGGLLDRTGELREQRSTQRTTRGVLGRFGITSVPRRIASVILGRDPLGDAQRSLVDSQRSLNDMLTSRGDIAKALHTVDRKLRAITKDGKVTKEEAERFARLTAARTNLRGRMTDIQSSIAEGIQSVYDAQVAAQQAAVDRINSTAERTGGWLDRAGRVASSLGNDGLTDRVNAARRGTLTTQANALDAQIARARSMGNTELADQLQAQVEDLRVSIFESLQQDVQTAIERVNNDAQRASTRLDIEGRIADVRARFGASGIGAMDSIGAARAREDINRRRGDILGDQRRQLNDLLQAQYRLPEAQRNITAMKTLEDQIADLDTSIVENTAAQRELAVATRQAALEMIQNRQQFQGGVFSNLASLAEAVGQQLNGDPAAAAANQATYLSQLGTTLRQTAIGLRDQLLAGYGIDLHGLSGINLADKIAELDFDQIESTMSEPDKQLFEGLINAVIENESALLSNTSAIDKLTGAQASPQTWSSSAWQWFREAIFTGMGDVMPQYQVPMAATGGVAVRQGIYHLEEGEIATPREQWERLVAAVNSAGGDTNFTINEAGGPIDYTHLAGVVAFARKTAQK